MATKSFTNNSTVASVYDPKYGQDARMRVHPLVDNYFGIGEIVVTKTERKSEVPI
jgi:hypothetical protein